MTATLWICIALFFTRVVAQIEVWLVQPAWLPSADAWYSGLLPYPLLLPVQIALLMCMTVLAWRGRISSPRIAVVVRGFAVCYFLIMVVRLALTIHWHRPDFYMHGAIPVAFHWVLALFALVLARPALVVGSPPAARQVLGRNV